MNPHTEIIDGAVYKVRKVTGILARILTGRNSYWAYNLIKPRHQYFKCLTCGRDRFYRKYQPHKCNGQFRKRWKMGWVVSSYIPRGIDK